ncbi:hypothetical protein CANCADRAFT_24269 [Tortispora caseinolytica NRRL Y-17796]|uniref:tRNA (guanine(26)-N(2))-dimethyltransferase n=1 Tax=Tortispora caseinolytica NRRL Y-17796 TaxID=767744 RepID=A0A1E4THU9_9ASCO|nr:hypothetical protein CANCADRAFT_24269 [Tortispora caseinolytica NRRL Y-17796]
MSSDNDYQKVKEGLATILYPGDESKEVFYNHIQQFNRDLSVVAIRTWAAKQTEKRSKKRKIDTDGSASEQPYIKIFEGLAASGLRSIRYAKEIPSVKSVVANDFSPSAVESINRNIQYNDVSNIVTSSVGDANVQMMLQRSAHQTKGRSPIAGQQSFHCIDIDPYGTAAPFIDQAVHTVSNDGLLLITCTDLAVLAGASYPEKCYANYGGLTNCGSEFSHESALRLVLGLIGTAAARHGRSIEPLLSLSIDYYLRVFVRVRTSPIEVKFLPSKMMTTYVCSGCSAVSTQPLTRATPTDGKITSYKHSSAQGPPVNRRCEHCGFVHHIGGPMWGSSLHDREFVQAMLDLIDTLDPEVYGTTKRMKAMLTLALEEIDYPFYFTPSHLAKVVHCVAPNIAVMMSALINGGYKVSGSHCVPGSIKTDAPFSFIWDVYREWIKEHPVSAAKLKDFTAAKAILEKSMTHDVDLTLADAVKELKSRPKVARYPQNPANWGPKSRANAQ